MGEPVSVPLWLFLAIVAFALWSLLDRLLIPSGRWFLRRRLNRLIDRVNRQLAVEIKPFQLTKRQVLIDRARVVYPVAFERVLSTFAAS